MRRLSARDLTRGSDIADRVEVADGIWQRFRGLMGRASLPAGHGLWFPGVNSIHMSFMRFPIDCLFLAPPGADGSQQVVALRESLPPWRGLVLPVKGAAGTLELPAGTLARCGTRVGDQVLLSEAG